MSTVACAHVCQGQAGQYPKRFLVFLTPVAVSAKIFETRGLSLDLAVMCGVMEQYCCVHCSVSSDLVK